MNLSTNQAASAFEGLCQVVKERVEEQKLINIYTFAKVPTIRKIQGLPCSTLL